MDSACGHDSPLDDRRRLISFHHVTETRMTSKKYWPRQSELAAFYGNPTGKNGKASPRWESENLIRVAVPWRMVAAWDAKIRITSITIHMNCVASLARVLQAIWLDAISEATAAGDPQKVIELWGLHLFGGGYNFRLKRGGETLSTHAYGCAIDFDPARNGMGDRTPNFANCPEVIRAFKAEGWEWGGDWSSPDAMHFQAATAR